MTPTRLVIGPAHGLESIESPATGALVGVSTGYMSDARMDWARLLDRAGSVSQGAVEISALSGPELPSLMRWSNQVDPPPFEYISVHSPTKDIRVEPSELARQLDELPEWVTSIVLHPDTLGRPQAFRALRTRLVLENMDFRKLSGRYASELESIFDVLPEAGFCLDVAHAGSLDPSMELAHALLDRFQHRLRQIHLSALDADGHHISITEGDWDSFASVLRRCPKVPIIFEAPPPTWLLQTDH